MGLLFRARARQAEKYQHCAVQAHDILISEPPDVPSRDIPVGNGVDESLVVPLMGACGDGERLSMGLGGKALRTYIGDPYLDGAKACSAQRLTVLLLSLGRGDA